MDTFAKTVRPVSDIDSRIRLFLWGPAGCGKTTLASTMPKPILFIQHDVGGVDVIRDVPDITVADFSVLTDANIEVFTTPTINGLTGYLSEQLSSPKPIRTIVLDSITAFYDAAIVRGVALNESTKNKITIAQPGQAGYGTRNNIVGAYLRQLILICERAKLHLVIIGHEATATTDETTNAIIEISIMLGGTPKAAVPIKMSEIWRMVDNGKERTLFFRNRGYYRPMKSRMFDEPGAVVKPDTSIEAWYERWKEGGYVKMKP